MHSNRRKALARLSARIAGMAMLASPLLSLSFSTALHAQGTLAVTPGPVAATVAGTGSVGYSGDAGAATSAAFASPGALARDTAGNLYVADRENHVVRMISPAGAVTTVAGSGQQGFAGDGGAATGAALDTPSGVAIDASGNLYIADSHNNRIREVGGGVISTIAGNGTAGFAGDGGAATASELAQPSAVAVDASGNLYIADTNNQRVRVVTGATISTLAGNGAEQFAGDGGPATAASLDTPTAIAVDGSGQVYIADKHNQRVRVVDATGTISTLAGGGSGLFGGFGGDGASATAAALAKPAGVSVDAGGNVWIADTGNQRIREVSGGAIATVAGIGDQGFDGDGGSAAAAILNEPRAVIADASGNFVVADTLNQRLRSSTLPTLAFTSQSAGAASAAQAITLSNTGGAALTIASVGFTGAFGAAAGGTCASVPIQLAAGGSCTQNITYLPSTAGTVNGSVTVSGPGIVPQTILLTGSAATASAAVALTASSAAAFAGQPVTLNIAVTTAIPAIATGTVTFYDGGAQIGSVQTLANDAASLTTSTLALGTHSITAAYSGDATYAGSTSAAITELIANADFTIVPNPSSPSGSTTQTVAPGQPAQYGLMIQPLAGPLSYPVILSATGLPPGATVSFNPQTITVGASAVNFTMTIQTAAASRCPEVSLSIRRRSSDRSAAAAVCGLDAT